MTDESDLQLAHDLADIADTITWPSWRGPLAVHTKGDGTIVTEVDVAVDEAIATALSLERPHDEVHAEESGVRTVSGARRRWYIDPLDQTVNYSRGLPEFATLIALYENTEPVCAVVSAPALRERWWATRMQGARNTSGPIGVSRTSAIENAVASIAAPHRFDDIRGMHSTEPSGNERVSALAHRCRATTGAGGFLGHMRVAEGKVDVTLDPWGEPWDLAASALIVKEAGGEFTALDGSHSIHQRSAVASNRVLHAEVVKSFLFEQTTSGS